MHTNDVVFDCNPFCKWSILSCTFKICTVYLSRNSATIYLVYTILKNQHSGWKHFCSCSALHHIINTCYACVNLPIFFENWPPCLKFNTLLETNPLEYFSIPVICFSIYWNVKWNVKRKVQHCCFITLLSTTVNAIFNSTKCSKFAKNMHYLIAS